VRAAGESGVGKTSVLKHMLRRLETPGGASLTNSGSVVGCVMNYTDKNQALLQSIAMLSGYDQHSEGLYRYRIT
jgi:ABC-type glutathione transport system ATPase component